jgi:hypothetical protein
LGVKNGLLNLSLKSGLRAFNTEFYNRVVKLRALSHSVEYFNLQGCYPMVCVAKSAADREAFLNGS